MPLIVSKFGSYHIEIKLCPLFRKMAAIFSAIQIIRVQFVAKYGILNAIASRTCIQVFVVTFGRSTVSDLQ